MQQAPPPPPAGTDPIPAAQQPSAPPQQGGAVAQQPVAAHLSNLARLVIAAVVVAAVVLTVFCAQNTGATSVHFLTWSWPGAPLFVVILASVGLGLLIGGLFVWLRLARYSAEHRILGRRHARR